MITKKVFSSEFCLQCTSSIGIPECITAEAPEFNAACPAPAGAFSCFSRVNEGKIQQSFFKRIFIENILFLAGQVVRGCFNSLDNATASECENETCRACHGLGCNGGIFPPTRLACHICTGNENSTCSGNVNSTHTICPIFRSDDQCYIARPNGNFERGCLSSNPTRCQDGEQCHLCNGNGCNYIDYNSAVNVFSVFKMIPFVLLSIAMAALNK